MATSIPQLTSQHLALSTEHKQNPMAPAAALSEEINDETGEENDEGRIKAYQHFSLRGCRFWEMWVFMFHSFN
ncbi:MAG: hypothetical protein ABI778_07715 [Ignavibacteriota bacterium]